jgi:hypothetical protein
MRAFYRIGGVADEGTSCRLAKLTGRLRPGGADPYLAGNRAAAVEALHTTCEHACSQEVTMTTVRETVERYLQIWNQRDAAARRASVQELFTDGCSYTDPLAAVTGRDGVDGFIAGVQQQFAGVRFVLAGNVDAHHDVARFTWHARADGHPEPLAIGFDVIVLEGGRIRQVVGFLDKAPS